jgi:hypothetical protein
MIPFFDDMVHTKRRPLTREENIRGFKIVGGVLLFVAMAYVIIAWLVFGHL